jgi:hypothetical protein
VVRGNFQARTPKFSTKTFADKWAGRFVQTIERSMAWKSEGNQNEIEHVEDDS